MSLELQNAIKNYENYIQVHGIDEQVINAYVDASTVAIKTEKNIPYGLQITKRAKEIIEQFCIKNSGGTIFDLEEYAFEHEQSYELINKYYEVLLLEAPHLFHSYLLYLEKNREESERFYQPKMKQLNKHGLIQAMQDLEDDKLDLLSISMPPGTQKTTLEKFFCSWIIGRHPQRLQSVFFTF